MKIVKRLLTLGVAASLSVAAGAADISGAGATFPYPIYAKWADAYKKLTGIGLNYQSIGSGGGIKQIKAKTVTFGASDMPLKPDALKALTPSTSSASGAVMVMLRMSSAESSCSSSGRKNIRCPR